MIKLKDKALLEDGLLHFLFKNVGNGTEFDLKTLKQVKTSAVEPKRSVKNLINGLSR